MRVSNLGTLRVPLLNYEKNFLKNFPVSDQHACLPEHLEHEHIVFTWPVFSQQQRKQGTVN